jgi:hypothetical protein
MNRAFVGVQSENCGEDSELLSTRKLGSGAQGNTFLLKELDVLDFSLCYQDCIYAPIYFLTLVT